MKNCILICCLFFAVISCKEEKKKAEDKEVSYLSFGENISDEDVISKEEMSEKFMNMKEGDTVSLKFASKINKVCKKKGCWMKLDLGNKKESMVRFKDYGFFVPLDADNKETIVEGRAYLTEISVDQLKHYAKDAGKSEEEIAKITKPEFTYAFEADGVLIKE